MGNTWFEYHMAAKKRREREARLMEAKRRFTWLVLQMVLQVFMFASLAVFAATGLYSLWGHDEAWITELLLSSMACFVAGFGLDIAAEIMEFQEGRR